MKAGLTIREETVAGVRVVHLSGYLDGHTCAELDRHLAPLLKSGAHRVVMELSGLGYIASAGVGVFINAQHHLEKSGGNLQLVNPGTSVKEIFAILGLESLFVIHPTLAAGLAAAGAKAP
jgi:anti-sigma B factor antagonist